MGLLTFDRVVKDYGTGQTRIRALDDVTLNVAPGEFVALYGPSGSGKTTLLQLAAGLDPPTGGRVLFRASDLADLGDGELNVMRRREVGFVFQFFNLVPALTAAENVALPLCFDGVAAKEAQRRTIEALSLVSLEERADHLASELSGGEMQRVALARALAPAPSLLLADEPTGSLDSRNGGRLLELIGDLCRRNGVAVVLASHDARAARYADRILDMQDGRVAEQSRHDGAAGDGRPAVAHADPGARA